MTGERPLRREAVVLGDDVRGGNSEHVVGADVQNVETAVVHFDHVVVRVDHERTLLHPVEYQLARADSRRRVRPEQPVAADGAEVRDAGDGEGDGRRVDAGRGEDVREVERVREPRR
ncbi:hypothetical protein [Halogeometricum sp. CBA1124]|uniref:hypothetical protein n=1 Tax=Halogeometricum sp. CBA1124 TaxID=2668071 RepID=UPI0031B6E0A3